MKKEGKMQMQMQIGSVQEDEREDNKGNGELANF
jgi:hypothetical protein